MFEKEVKEKWGHTQAYKEYEEQNHSNQVQAAFAAEMDHIIAEFANCMTKGEKPESEDAQCLVQKLQEHITKNYYRCTDEILFGLGKMYVADERFQNNIDKHGNGTAAFICKAIESFCQT